MKNFMKKAAAFVGYIIMSVLVPVFSIAVYVFCKLASLIGIASILISVYAVIEHGGFEGESVILLFVGTAAMIAKPVLYAIKFKLDDVRDQLAEFIFGVPVYDM